MEAEELFLCLPCAERLKDFQTVESIKVGRHRRDKDVCEQCGRRRFGYLCEVKFRGMEERKCE
ncbi:MAG: hypothetical protein VB039_05205 [Oscillospiraceae bacterium]|nr:hypothetical protein [Oscillospiraceae bacterium]